MLTKDVFEKVGGGASLRFVLYFYQSHTCLLSNIVSWKSKEPQNSSVNETKRTYIHRIIDRCFLVM